MVELKHWKLLICACSSEVCYLQDQQSGVLRMHSYMHIYFYYSLHIQEEMIFVLGVGVLQLPSSLLVFLFEFLFRILSIMNLQCDFKLSLVFKFWVSSWCNGITIYVWKKLKVSPKLLRKRKLEFWSDYGHYNGMKLICKALNHLYFFWILACLILVTTNALEFPVLWNYLF